MATKKITTKKTETPVKKTEIIELESDITFEKVETTTSEKVIEHSEPVIESKPSAIEVETTTPEMVIEQPEPVKVQKVEQSTSNPKFPRGQKVFLKNENMKPYLIKKQDPDDPNKWHVHSMHGNGLAHDLKIVDEKDIFITIRNV